MIKHGLVPVKQSQLHRLTIKYVGEGKPEAPLFWSGLGSGRPEIMLISDLKRKFFPHEDQCTGNQWLRKDTAEALHDAKLANVEQMGINASCIRSPAENTVSVYHLVLMSAPEIVRRAGVY